MTKEELLQITKAATNLHGVLTLLELKAVISNYYPDEKMTVTLLEEELLAILPDDHSINVKHGLVFLEVFLFDEEKLKEILKKQQGKKGYLPQRKEEFLRYASEEYYRPTLEWKNLRRFFLEARNDEEEVEELLSKIRFAQQFSYPIETTFRCVLDHDFLPVEQEKEDEMIELLIEMDNTARKCEHKGNSLWEIKQS